MLNDFLSNGYYMDLTPDTPDMKIPFIEMGIPEDEIQLVKQYLDISNLGIDDENLDIKDFGKINVCVNCRYLTRSYIRGRCMDCDNKLLILQHK